MDFYLVILWAGYGRDRQMFGLLQSHSLQGLIVLPVDGKTEQYRRVVKWSMQKQSTLEVEQWPDWFDAMPLKTVTLI